MAVLGWRGKEGFVEAWQARCVAVTRDLVGYGRHGKVSRGRSGRVTYVLAGKVRLVWDGCGGFWQAG